MDWAVTPAREPAKNRIPVDEELFVNCNDFKTWKHNSFTEI